ncbi:MAG: cobyrinate a,c-diamide synthase [Desulfofustis sp.]|nr:cobyrinate a,c-diamide synthase [Desulfofustis sp.]
MREKVPAFIIAAAKSGSGKTTLTLGIVAALVKRGLEVQCFKCGPDFIDPTLHRAITFKDSYNLDLRMMGAECCRRTFAEKSRGADAVVVEGVMGLFDGGEASTAALAKELDLPVLLVVDAASAAESAAAVVHGFQTFDPELVIRQVIFNNIGSPRHRQLIENAVTASRRLDFVGFFHRDDNHHIAERHLGLHMGNEQPLGEAGLDLLIDAVEQQLDIDEIISHSLKAVESTAFPDATAQPVVAKKEERTLRLGLAQDEAFCFYYPQNLELFEARGFELVRFSPIHDQNLPKQLDMLYLGGGYPENYGAALCQNQTIRYEIIEAHQRNLPIYAECGGFMYLCRSLQDMEGVVHEMTGIFPFDTVMNKRLRKLGYRQVTLLTDCILGARGDRLKGHEFHYSDLKNDTNNCEIDNTHTHLYALDNNSHEGYSVGSALGSYVHLHFGDSASVIDHIHKSIAGHSTP